LVSFLANFQFGETSDFNSDFTGFAKQCCHFHSVLRGHLIAVQVPLAGRRNFSDVESSVAVLYIQYCASGPPSTGLLFWECPPPSAFGTWFSTRVFKFLTPSIPANFQKEPRKPYQIQVQFQVLRLNAHKLHGLKEGLSILMKDKFKNWLKIVVYPWIVLTLSCLNYSLRLFHSCFENSKHMVNWTAKCHTWGTRSNDHKLKHAIWYWKCLLKCYNFALEILIQNSYLKIMSLQSCKLITWKIWEFFEIYNSLDFCHFNVVPIATQNVYSIRKE
jgi:hypothetical protein